MPSAGHGRGPLQLPEFESGRAGRGESSVEGSFGSVRAGGVNALAFGEMGLDRLRAHFTRRFGSRSKLNTCQPRSRAMAATSASTKSTLRSR